MAYVKTLGQVEGVIYPADLRFGTQRKLKRQDLLGLTLIVLAAVLVMWA